jgi:3-deoxy-D-manno-octulosonic-acid transferase
MYLFYSILYLTALIFLLPFEYIKRPKELRKKWLKERFGFFNALRITHHASRIWIHAVSVGEVIAAVPLIKKIKERYSLKEIVVSTVTDTGQRVATEKIGDIARIIYAPFDIPFAINSAVRKIKPSFFIIMETELWPNIIRILNRKGVPVLLMNGRISEKSFRGYKKLRFFINPVLKDVRIFCMQNELYAERIKAMGAQIDKVKVIGNFKFDTKPSSHIPEWTRILKSQASSVKSQLPVTSYQLPVKSQEFTIIAGSTHRTEEEIILNAYIKIKNDFPATTLIIAPRHPERFREVEDLIKKRGLSCLKVSEIKTEDEKLRRLEDKRKTENKKFLTSQSLNFVILLDVIGELSSVYSVCDVAIMGGSFIKHGGQNPLEPAYWGKAIICGHHMENFSFINEFYKGGGALKVDADNLYESLRNLLASPEKMSSMGSIANKLYNKNSGATDRAMEIIGTYL